MLDPIGIAHRQPESMDRSRTEADPDKLQDAANQFEALLATQLLKASRDPDSGGWLGCDGDQSAGCAMEFAEEQFAQAFASSGGLGLARLIVTGLQRK